MSMRVVHLLAGLFASFIGTFASASPPPPPPQFMENIARQLVSTPNASNFANYTALLADDLKVTANGKTLVTSKGDWVMLERARLGKVNRFVYGFAADDHSILVLDRFDDLSAAHCPSGDTCVLDPRWLARAVWYEIGADHLVHQIRILQTDSIMQTPKD